VVKIHLLYFGDIKQFSRRTCLPVTQQYWHSLNNTEGSSLLSPMFSPKFLQTVQNSVSSPTSNYILLRVSNSKVQNYQKKMLLTCESSCLSKTERASTTVGRDTSWGSIFVHNLLTTAIAEWSVSLWTRPPFSLMSVSTAVKPPPSKTAPASLVQINSKT